MHRTCSQSRSISRRAMLMWDGSQVLCICSPLCHPNIGAEIRVRHSGCAHTEYFILCFKFVWPGENKNIAAPRRPKKCGSFSSSKQTAVRFVSSENNLKQQETTPKHRGLRVSGHTHTGLFLHVFQRQTM